MTTQEFPIFCVVNEEMSGTTHSDNAPLERRVRRIEFAYGAGGCWIPANGLNVWLNGTESSRSIRHEGGDWLLVLSYKTGSEIGYRLQRVNNGKELTPEVRPEDNDVLPSALLIKLLNSDTTDIDINDHSGLIKLSTEVTLDLAELLYLKEMTL